MGKPKKKNLIDRYREQLGQAQAEYSRLDDQLAIGEKRLEAIRQQREAKAHEIYRLSGAVEALKELEADDV
jgi:DNA repair ATPase RecN